MFALSDDDLGEIATKGDLVVFKGKLGAIEYVTDKNGKETNLLGFISYDDTYYLVTINDRLMPGVELLKS